MGEADTTALLASAGRARRPEGPRVRIGACRVEADLDRIVGPDRETALEPKAMAVLMHLVRHAGQVVSAGELIEAVWRGRPMSDNPVYRCIAQLRRAFGDDPKAPTYIATVPTKGYRLIAAVEPLDPRGPLPPASVADASTDTSRRPPGKVAPARHPRRRLVVLLATPVLLVLLAGMALLAGARRSSTPAPAPPASAMLAVLPLQPAVRAAPDLLAAQAMTDLVRHQLARVPGLVVLADTSSARLDDSDPRAAGRRLGVRYLLRGTVARAPGRLHADLVLVDAASGMTRWHAAFEQPVTDMGPLRDAVLRQVARALRLRADPAAKEAPADALRLDTYEIFVRGQQRLAKSDAADAAEAAELFRRATLLEPAFARAYLGLGQALAQQADASVPPSREMRERASRALVRAVELDPWLGEAWSERARFTPDPARAEAFYRRGLAMAPSDGPGYAHYAAFLLGQARVDEALQAIDRARRIDPLEPRLCLTRAFLVMAARGDVAEHDRLLREALRIRPRFAPALYQLAYSKWEYSGEFAQAAQLAEQAIAAEPRSMDARMLVRDIYLDLGDPAAAAAVLGPSAPLAAGVEIAQYGGNRLRAAAVLENTPPQDWPDHGPQAAKAQAVRDAAIASGKLRPAVDLLRSVQAAREHQLPMASRGDALVYAHLLVLAGEAEQGRRLARATLALVDGHGTARGDWFSRERAAAYAVLGDDERALQELRHSVEHGQLYRWWYLARRDPLYVHLRADPRFRALDRMARAHRERQRTLLDAARRRDSMLGMRQAEEPML